MRVRNRFGFWALTAAGGQQPFSLYRFHCFRSHFATSRPERSGSWPHLRPSASRAPAILHPTCSLGKLHGTTKTDTYIHTRNKANASISPYMAAELYFKPAFVMDYTLGPVRVTTRAGGQLTHRQCTHISSVCSSFSRLSLAHPKITWAALRVPSARLGLFLDSGKGQVRLYSKQHRRGLRQDLEV